jgi:23S rRNA (uridine2552-2'-O)-methyltransferase
MNYRSRAAFKLKELQEKFSIISKDDMVLDLGSSPGGWSQVALEFTSNVVAVDLMDMDELPNLTFIHGDITLPEILEQVKNQTNGIDVVLSDMAHPFTGHKSSDVPRLAFLVEFALQVALQPKMLKEGGNFVAKFLHGSGSDELRDMLKRYFHSVQMSKPKACRKESAESYFICKGYNGSSFNH